MATPYRNGSLQTLAPNSRVLVGPNQVPAVVRRTNTGKNVLRFAKAADPTEAANVRNQLAKAQAARQNPKPITQAQAQKAFNAYYGRTRNVSRGARKGQPVFKSPRGRKAARTYDLGHTSKNVVADSRYLRRHGPRNYDFRGVDTGANVRKAPSAKQLSALARGRARGRAAAARRQGDRMNALFQQQGAGRHQQGGYQQQEGGFWW